MPVFYMREQMQAKGADGTLTKEEASARFNIPLSVLDEYESWGLCGSVKQVMGCWQYTDADIERLSTIMALHDMGFEAGEVEMYMRLLLSDRDTSSERIKMLESRRAATLSEIHFKERQLERQDYLRYRLRQASMKE